MPVSSSINLRRTSTRCAPSLLVMRRGASSPSRTRTVGLRVVAVLVAALSACGGTVAPTDASSSVDVAADRPLQTDVGVDVSQDRGAMTTDRDAGMVEPADAPADAPVSREDRPAAATDAVASTDALISTGDDRDDARCGPENGEARCGPMRCCSRFGWCGNLNEEHCNKYHGFDGMYDGPR